MTNAQLYILLAAPIIVAIIQGALLIKYIDAKIDGVNSKIDAKIDGVNSKIDAKIDGVNSKIDGLQKQIDQVLSRLTGIETALRGLYEIMGRHDKAIEVLERGQK